MKLTKVRAFLSLCVILYLVPIYNITMPMNCKYHSKITVYYSKNIVHFYMKLTIF